MKICNVLDIAKYFIDSGMFLNHKKLQKLVYYAYSWYLVKNNKNANNIENRLFDSRIEAWTHGPVCPELYYAYNENKILNYESKIKDEKIIKLLELVIKVYGKYTGEELEEITHNEEPWQKARKDYKTYERSHKKIEDRDIYEFYSNKII